MAKNRFFAIALAWFCSWTTNISDADELTPIAIGNINFVVAKGLTLDQVADPELIQWPIAAAYHPNGDLLILECHWNRESVQKQLESKPHKIVRLSDTNGDRKFDNRMVLADGLGFPEGIMVLGNDLLVSAPPQILKLSDKDGDGYYEAREVWFDAGTLTHCANDLHGPILGPDGWVYWAKGAFAEQKHSLIARTNADKEFSTPSKAAHIYRRHPNGGPIERLMTGGMDNPSDLTFSPEGERFFCSTFMHHPGNGLRDGIGHAPRGGMFGKQHQVLDGHWTTGPLLQPIANIGPAAPASVHYLKSHSIAESTLKPTSSPAGNQSGFLVTSQFNLHKIGLHRLVPSGSSFQTENVDLLSADRVDFHPVDVLEEPDGSLLVFDTGGWYDLCCPSSGSDQKIAMGGIYRLRAVDVKNKAIKNIAIENSQRSVEQAMQIASDRTRESLLRKESIWQLAREITASPKNTDAMERIIQCLRDSDSSVQQTAASVVGLNRWKNAMPALLTVLESREPATVRSALESLGVVGDSSCLKPILEAMARFPEDRLIKHSGIYALMEIGDVDGLVSIAMQAVNETDLHSTVVALNQLGKIPDGLLPRLVQRLAGSSQELRDLSIECLAKSPQGVSLCLPFLESAWEREDTQQLAAGVRIVHVGRTNSALVARVAQWMQVASSVSAKRQDFLLTCLQQVSEDRVPAEWSKPLSAWIKIASNETMMKIADSIRKAKFSDEDRVAIVGELRERAEANLKSAPEVAMAALASSPNHAVPLSVACSRLVVEQFVAPESKLASLAGAALSRSQMDVESARELVARLEQVPSLYLQTAMDALLRCTNADIDRILLEKLPSVPAIKTLAVEKVVAGVNGRSDEVKKQWTAMMQTAIRPPENIAKELDAWLERLPQGDAKRGYQVFSNAKAACSSCHQIGYVGGKLGPELSSIGRTRTRRDLVEAIVYPSLRMAQGYNPIRIRTVDDEVFNGLLSKQTDTHIELLCGADKISRIEKSEIEEQSESKQSVMPSGLDQQISLNDFADLLAFLESKR
jgi:putative heme-binding domain-containing protein